LDPASGAERLAQGLYPHQVEGLAFLLGRRRSILADDMGLGKTRQSVLAMTTPSRTVPGSSSARPR
jgi:SNF2 family DNA or RNA helicase